MIRFYFHTSPNPMKVALFLEEAGLDYEVAPVDTRKGDQHDAAFRAINPNGKTPAIVDDGVAVFDSNAILLYLAEKTGRFLGAPGDRAELLSWLMVIATGLGPFGGQAFHFTFVAPQEAYARNRYQRELERHLRLLDERLRGRDWFVGRDYSIVDMAAWGWIRVLGGLLGERGLAAYPDLKAWFDRVEARPAAIRASQVGADIPFKKEMDETAIRVLFPQNFPEPADA